MPAEGEEPAVERATARLFSVPLVLVAAPVAAGACADSGMSSSGGLREISYPGTGACASLAISSLLGPARGQLFLFTGRAV